ncbi:MAG: VanZ family protein [Lachnospiraceae bacterium]|jgi:Predicted integral membrane protein|nr:VanZ family protein [Lachnospiraceae bacterium]MCI8826579.1 VanZ family protein [Lachnospiraceae bacterium]MCI9371519.1 VanZ family protein [Lachnospiraceae bacterium]
MKEQAENHTININTNRSKKIILWILIIFWMLLIFIFSSQNSEDSSNLSRGFLRNFILWFLPENIDENTVDFLEHILRKCAHMTEYAVLGILISIQLRLYHVFEAEWKKIWAAIFLVMLYAATDEFHQLFVGGRSGQVTDVLIDTCGGMAGAFIIYLIYKLKNLRKTENGGKK